MKQFILALSVLLATTLAASAQTNNRNPCYYLTPTSSSCQPVSPTTPLPVTGTVTVTPTLGPASAANSTPTVATSQYPVNNVTTLPSPLANAANGTTGAVVATITPTANSTAYICGFNVSAVGGVATVGPIVVAGLLGGSQSYEMNSAATPIMLSQNFMPCVPASAVNTPITVTTVANGTATAVHVNLWGYRL